jgi:hypothetical protein
MLIDLQLHSTYSDGYLTPTRLADLLSKKGIRVASLTDHNTVRGQYEFWRACQKKGIKTIPGLEIYTKLEYKRFNILWYNFSDHRHLHEMLRHSQIRRRNNIRRILKRLNFDLDIERTLDKYTKYIPINHIIDDILEVESNKKRIQEELDKEDIRLNDVIDNYFRNKEIGILRESCIDIKRVLDLKEKLGGEVILNHPGKYGGAHLKEDFISRLKEMGVDGVEKLSPHHSYSTVMYLQHIARKYDLIETGGSDFHTHAGDNYPVQNSWEYFKIEDEQLRRIKEIIG